jgi:hypothetical protein
VGCRRELIARLKNVRSIDFGLWLQSSLSSARECDCDARSGMRSRGWSPILVYVALDAFTGSADPSRNAADRALSRPFKTNPIWYWPPYSRQSTAI